MTLQEFLKNPPSDFKWTASAIERMKPNAAFLAAEITLSHEKMRCISTRKPADCVKILDLSFATGGGKVVVNGQPPVSWGEGKKQIVAIMRGKTPPSAPARSASAGADAQKATPYELRTTWVNYDLLEKMNARAYKESCDYWDKHDGQPEPVREYEDEDIPDDL